jgi:uncharacterized protein (DUF1778 family)
LGYFAVLESFDHANDIGHIPKLLGHAASHRWLIDRAAKQQGKTRADFVLDAARKAAEEALLDRTLIVVSPEAYAAFVKQLDAPPRSNAKLRRTMQSRAPWD